MKNRRRARSVQGAILVLILSGALAAQDPNCAPPAPCIQKWTVLEFWQQLQVKMADHQVLELLGEPLAKESTETACVWYYQEAPKLLESGLMSRPRFGFITFRKAVLGGQDTRVLKTWKQPDWNIVQASTAAQYEAAQRRAERLHEEALQRKEMLEKQKQAEAERLRQEEELRRQQLAQQQAAAEQAQAESKRGFSFSNLPRTYWYAAGGIAAGLVIAVVLIKRPFMD